MQLHGQRCLQGEPGVTVVEFSGHPIMKFVNLIRKVKNANAFVCPLAERFEEFLKFTRQLSLPGLLGKLPEQ